MTYGKFVCPTDRGPLEFHPMKKGELDGFLLNRRLEIAYPVMQAVARFISLDAESAKSFEARYGQSFARELPGFKLASD